MLCGARNFLLTFRALVASVLLLAMSLPSAAVANVGRGDAKLPIPVAEMRAAILEAAASGSLDELLVPIQWNELPPDFGEQSVADTLATWKKESKDGSGRELLELLSKLLQGSYLVLHQGRDVENSKIFIWPGFARMDPGKLTPDLEAELKKIVTAQDLARMKSIGRYDGYALAIGADGTWHSFKPVPPHNKSQ